MRIGIALGLVVNVGFLAPLQAMAADRMEAGAASFTPPERWAVRKQPDGLVRITSPDDNAMILVMPGEAFDGDLREAFNATWKSLRQGLQIDPAIPAGEPEAGTTDAGYEFVDRTSTVVDRNGNRLTCYYLLLRNGEAVCGLAYLGEAKAYKRFEAAYDALAAGFELGGERQTAPKPAPVAKDEPRAEEPEPDVAPVPGAPAAAARQGRAAPEPPQLEAGAVVGRITDARGNIIDGAKFGVSVSGTTLRGERTSLTLEVGEDGLYAQEVPDGLYRIYGTIELEYNGHKYRLPLHPEDNKDIGTSQSSKKGIVKNFVWKLTGLKPGSDKTLPGSYYGGTVELVDAEHYNRGQRIPDRHPGAKVVVVLEPRGRLIDGSHGKAIRIEAETAALGGTLKYPDIPIGRYAATATLVRGGGGQVPLKVGVRYVGTGVSEGKPARSVEVEFVQPSIHEGVRQAQLVLSE